jgi:hypothetical protein
VGCFNCVLGFGLLRGFSAPSPKGSAPQLRFMRPFASRIGIESISEYHISQHLIHPENNVWSH